MRNKTVIAAAMTAVLVTGIAVARGQVQLDPGLQPYRTVSGVSGNLSSVGSDTLNNLMTHWAETFSRFYPNAKVQIEGKGSSTAPPALIAGTAQLGPMSREMKPSEIDEFEKKFGYPPTKIKVAIDALAIFVNKDNPLKELTLQQADAIFSKGRACGGPKDITTWGDLGLSGDWAAKPISLYGRNSASGTYGFFKEHALCNGDYKDTVKEQPGSASVVQGVSEDRNGAGYSGIGYATSGVRAVPLSAKQGDPFHEANYQNVVNGSYPLSRFLFIYINRASDKPLDPLVREFCKFVLSKEGQAIVIKDGYYPLPATTVNEELAKLQ